ncbi:MAG: DnaA/Hda family protein [Planctomycetota bacterium]
MSASQGSNETQEAEQRFTDALRERLGQDTYRLWFSRGVTFACDLGGGGRQPSVQIQTGAVFAAKRIEHRYMAQLRWAAMTTLGDDAVVRVGVKTMPAADPDGSSQPHADLTHTPDAGGPHVPQAAAAGAKRGFLGDRTKRPSRGGKGKVNALSTVLASESAISPKAGVQADPVGPRVRDAHVGQASVRETRVREDAGALSGFVVGPCNEFTHAAVTMAMDNPAVANPLYIYGGPGTGKSTLLSAMAKAFKQRRRFRRVVALSAEQFTNDFVASVNTTGLPAFRARYRDVDALLIDDVHFLAGKSATLREVMYTIETLVSAGKPLVLTANGSPLEVRGMTGEVAGRMGAGLVCPLLAIDIETRLELLRRSTETRCVLPCEEGFLRSINELLGGDARSVTGVANLIGMLQRMYRRQPTLSELERFGGDLLRSQNVPPTLRRIERAVCETFGIEGDGLRGKGQTRRVSQPRMLAMYLARELTGSAFTEIAKHFGRRSHSGAITAQEKVQRWIEDEDRIQVGGATLSVNEAIARVEARLRTG